MVGQPAVGERNIRSAFDHKDFSPFIQPAQARCTRCPACHSAYYDDFHIIPPATSEIYGTLCCFLASCLPSYPPSVSAQPLANPFPKYRTPLPVHLEHW